MSQIETHREITQLARPVVETPLEFTLQLLLIGAATGAISLSLFMAYAVLAPRVRRYVARLRMRRIRQRRSPPERRGDQE